MRNKPWLSNALWIVLFWTLFFLIVTTPADVVPYCATYEQC